MRLYSLLESLNLGSYGIAWRFPTCWKFARMISVHKKACKRAVDNCQGITPSSAVSIFLELVVMETLNIVYCIHIANSIWAPINMDLLKVVQLPPIYFASLTQNMTERLQIDVIYSGLSAAFDKLYHVIAVAKHRRLDARGNHLSWFHSYITGRGLIVTIDRV